MTKQASNCPHFPKNPVAFNTGDQVVLPITVARYRNGKAQLYLYSDCDMFSKGANATANAIIRTILAQPSAIRPPVLFIQLDNSDPHYKNSGFYAFCAALVACGIYTEVRVNFLLVGHTHEDMDQCCNQIWNHLNRHTALTPQAMFELWGEAVVPAGIVNPSLVMYDYVSWLHPFTINLRGITKPHCVTFTMSTSGVCIVCACVCIVCGCYDHDPTQMCVLHPLTVGYHA